CKARCKWFVRNIFETLDGCNERCNSEAMSTATKTYERLQFTLADRMGKALQAADISNQQMADYLGVSRTSVSNWTNGRIAPNTQTMRLWALRTGAPLEWLRTGILPTGPNN